VNIGKSGGLIVSYEINYPNKNSCRYYFINV